MSHTDYLMCSPEECQDRQRHKEVSVFECVDPHVPVNQRVLDPGLAVTKYRRSAAGSEKKYPIRSLEQLQTTVTYLLQLLVSRRTIYCDSRQSFLATVNFVEDRVRAIQVDLVLSRAGCQRIQHQLACCHILICYVLVDCPDYQHAFGHSALETAFSSYWSSGCDDQADSARDDEILALSSLIQLNSSLLKAKVTASEDSPTLHELYSLYRKHISATTTSQYTYPLFQWSLRLVVNAHLGLWHVILRQLREGQSDFDKLARCCLAPSMPYMQYKALEAYNTSFGKGEAVSGQDLVWLLQFTSDSSIFTEAEVDPRDTDPCTIAACLEFGAALGLPVHENQTSLVFKSAPLKDFPSSTRARNDSFVFGQPSSATDANGLQLPPMDDLQSLLVRTSCKHIKS